MSASAVHDPVRPPRLAGRVAVITGAAGGIGAASARRFATEGASLLLTDADASGVAHLAEELGATSQIPRAALRFEFEPAKGSAACLTPKPRFRFGDQRRQPVYRIDADLVDPVVDGDGSGKHVADVPGGGQQLFNRPIHVRRLTGARSGDCANRNG